MRRSEVRLVGTAVLAAVVLGFSLVAMPFRHGVIVQVWLLGCGALILLKLVVATRAPTLANEPSAFERALREQREAPERPPELARLERELVLGVAGQFYLHRRLRPTLREIAEQRLRDHRGLDLDSGDAEVPEILGDDAWALLRADRTEHWDPDAAGIRVPELDRVVAALERI